MLVAGIGSREQTGLVGTCAAVSVSRREAQKVS